jgi:hypothetical protein
MSPGTRRAREEANHLFRVTIIIFPWHMFCQGKCLHFLLDGGSHNILQGTFPMTAVLA